MGSVTTNGMSSRVGYSSVGRVDEYETDVVEMISSVELKSCLPAASNQLLLPTPRETIKNSMNFPSTKYIQCESSTRAPRNKDRVAKI